MELPTYEDIIQARTVVSRHLPRTPCRAYPALSALLGCELWVKHENHLPTGAFKVRGGIHRISSLAPEERARGVITATRGNHGLSIAYAARLFGVRAVLVVPRGNNPEKNEGMLALGGELVEHGRDFDEALAHSLQLADRQGLRFVHPANEPALVAGVGTYALEIFEDVPEIDVMIVPIGLGSAISGVSLAREKLSPRTLVVGVQAERAPAVYLSWKEKRRVTTESADTVADGLATRAPAEMTQALIDRMVDRIVTVGEQEILEAVRLLLRCTHNLAEGAGAAALAAAVALRSELAGKRVVVVLSGGNIDGATLEWVLQEAPDRVSLLLYTRPDCPLCDEMKKAAEEVSREFPCLVAEIDVTRDPRLESRFHLEVPVLFVNGRRAASGRVGAKELRKVVREESGRNRWPRRSKR